MDKAQQKKLQEFFANEAYDVIQTSHQKLQQSQANPTLYTEYLTWIAQEMHSFRQDSNLMGYFDLANMAYQLEGEARRIIQARSVPEVEDVERLGVYLENLQLFLDFYNQKSGDTDSVYRVRKGFQVSDDVINLYLVEVQDHVELYHRTLIDLDTGKLNPVAAIEEMYRAVHSIKGDSNALGFFKIADLAHNLESSIEKFLSAPDQLNETVVNELFQWGEDLKDVVSQEVEGRHDEAIQNDEPDAFIPNEEVESEQVPDPEITALYGQEAQEILQDLHHYFALIFDRQELKLSVESAYRALHTLKGNSNALGFSQIGVLAGHLESAMAELKKSPESFEIEKKESFVTQFQALTHAVYALDSTKKSPLWQFGNTEPVETEEPDEITVLYLAEAQDILEDLAPLLARLEEKSPKAKKVKKATLNDIDNLYRGIHTLKGNSNALGFDEIGELAHDLETLLAKLKQEPLLLSASLKKDLETQFAVLSEKLNQLISPAAGGHTPSLSVVKVSSPPQAITTSPAESEAPLDELALLYKEEAESILEEVETLLIGIDTESSPDSEVLASIYRGIHTLKGNSNALGFEDMGQLANRSESLLNRLRTEPEMLTAEVKTQLLQDILELKLALPGHEQLAIASPQSLVTSDFDKYAEDIPEQDEIALLYREEATEIIATLHALLLKLESGEIELKTALESIYRGIHTLKGNSNALGFQNIGQLAHETESLLSELKKTPEKLTPEILEHLFNDISYIEKSLPSAFSSEEHQDTEIAFEAIAGLDEITSLYLQEAHEISEYMSLQLLQLESGDLELKPALDALYRSLHTLKGNSNALGFEQVGQIAHEAESDLQRFKASHHLPDAQEFERLFKYQKAIAERLQTLALGEKQKLELQAKHQAKRQTLHQKKSITQELRITQSGLKLPSLSGKSTSQEASRKRDANWQTNDLLTTGSGKKKLQNTGSHKQKQRVQADETIRVSVSKIDQLINLSDELLIHKISYEQKLVHLFQVQTLLTDFRKHIRGDSPDSRQLTQYDILNNLQHISEKLNFFEKELKEDINDFALTVDEMQYQSRKTRMLPASVLVDPLRLVVRSTSQKLSKKVDFIVLGDDTELDRFLVEKLKDPLGHLIRNAIDHGLETAEERQATTKPERSQILVQISLSGNQVVFQIQDDGRGIDYERIRQKAVKIGLFDEAQSTELSESDLNRLLFSSGFSTAEKVTDISGRGVGLDVVHANIESLNGQIEIFTEKGQGTQFRISLPVTLSTFDTFIIRLEQQRFAVPSALISATRLLSATEIKQHEGQYVMTWESQLVPVIPMHDFLGIAKQTELARESRILMLNLNQRYLGLIVDDIIEARALVMKQMGQQLQNVPNVAGATILGDGEPIVVLNLQDMYYGFYQEDRSFDLAAIASGGDAYVEADADTAEQQIHVLVVDDSVTTRTLEKNILEAAGFKVTIATNGQEAKDKVPGVLPDIIITDCEMPVMDGYGFTAWVKKESPYKHIPMIMVTSLAEDEFKQKAFAAGVNDFIVKGQFKQDIFLEKINTLLPNKKSIAL